MNEQEREEEKGREKYKDEERKKIRKTFAHPNRLRIIEWLTIRNATGFRFEESTQVIPLKIFYE